MKIAIEGFQSIANPITVEVEGLTVITGESNIGKSAIIRAVNALLENQPGSWFITEGQSQAEVVLESNNHKIQWTKSRKTTEYIIDGTVHGKAGRGIPEGIDSLGFYQVIAQGQRFRPQIQRQFDKPFIIGEKSPTTAAELLAANKQSAIIARAIKISQKVSGEKSTELSLLEQRCSIYDSRLRESTPSEELLRVQSEALHNLKLKVTEQSEKVNTLRRLLTSYKSVQKKHAVEFSREKLLSVPDKQRDIRVRELAKRYATLVRTAKGLQTLPPKINSIKLTVEADSLKRYKDALKLNRNLSKRLVFNVPGKLQEVPTGKLRDLSGKRKDLAQFLRLRRQEIQKKMENEQNLDRVKAEIPTLEKEKQRILVQLGICPVCGK